MWWVNEWAGLMSEQIVYVIIIHKFYIKCGTEIRLGPLKFSLRATIDLHGPSIHSSHYTASINCCKKTFYCNDHIFTEFGIIDSRTSSTAFVILYELIDTWFLDSNRKVGVWSLPWRWHILFIPLTTGRGTGAETCGLDDVFPPDDLCSRPEALCQYIYIYIYAIYIFLYEFCFLWFTSCVLLSDDNSLIPGCLWLLAFVLNNTLTLRIWCSTIPHIPGCFCPWIFFPNIRFNMVPSDPFMSHLATQLRYSAKEFQALQLIVLATFGVVD